VLIKDNIETADKMMTTAGSLALAGMCAKRDATIVRKLRKAGAVILGKTNLSEWANFRSTRSTSGWSGRGGQTRNPYALDRNPCGSSSGSGVAASAGLCAVAIGTETNGSIVCPSAVNGIVGIKPTVGLVSRAGIIPLAHSQDTAGPMARSVADAAAVLAAIAGIDPRDPATEDADRGQPDYAACLDPSGLRGKRLGVARQYFGKHEKVDEVMEQAIKDLKRLGATVVDPAEFKSGGYGRAGLDVLLYEFKADLNRYLADLPAAAAVHSLAELIAFNENNRDREMPFFGQELLLQAQAKGDLTDQQYVAALDKVRRVARDEGIDATLKSHQLDAMVAPTCGPAWVTDWITGDHGFGGSSTPAARAGYPSVTVPAGAVFGLPVGLSFFGRAYSEPLLLGLAYAYEQGTRHRRAPKYLAHAEFGPASSRKV
jgi:amidase